MVTEANLDAAKYWYAVRSKPSKEVMAARLLDRANIEVYVPQAKLYRGGTKRPVLAPFFPGYLFCRFAPASPAPNLVRYTYGVLYIVGAGEEIWPVPDDLIASLQTRLAGGSDSAVAPFARGDRVVITEGPFREIEAVFDRALTPTGRVQVLMEILKRVCRVELHMSQLRSVREGRTSR